MIGIVAAPSGMHEAGISSSAAVGVACLLALEAANQLCITPEENIELDRQAHAGQATLTMALFAHRAGKASVLPVFECLWFR